ncbi:MAG: hypothetical protein IPM06_00555 [Rhizobiales bacterium]|jgi:hypothetical protein|nr:hypothetical protein [Hyphomicrobiales bacterium]
MNIIRIASIAAALALATGAASAASLVNADKAPYRINYMPAHGKLKHITLAAGHEAKINCMKGGMLSMGKLSEQCDAKTQKITIRGGKFVI